MSCTTALAPAAEGKGRATSRSGVSAWLARAVTALSLAGPAALWGVLGWQRRWVAEDGFITLRVVRQLEVGHGPVFNAGERVEASTSTLWTVVLAVVHAVVHVRLELLAVGLGLALSMAGLFLASAAAQRLWSRPGAMVVPLGALVVICLPPFWDFATSGLESGLAFAWIGIATFVVAHEVPRPSAGVRRRVGAVAVGLGPLVRPDLVLVAAPLLLALAALQSGRGPRRLQRASAVMALGLAVPVAYQCFRMGYYGALVPNPGLAKEASASWWSQGARYVTDLFGPYHLLVPAAAVAAALAALMRTGGTPPGVGTADHGRRLATAAVAPALGGLLHGLYVVRVGGDFMHGRLLLPSVFAVCAPVMVVAPRHLVAAAAATGAAVWAGALTFALPGATPGIPPSGIADERATWVALTGRKHPVRVEDYRSTPFWRDGAAGRQLEGGGEGGVGVRLEQHDALTFLAPRAGGVTLTATQVGVVGMAAGPDVRIVDLHGISDALGAHVLRQGHARIGHEKRLDPAWIWARYVAPDAPLPPGAHEAGTVPTQAAISDAEAALACGALHRLVDATEARLTPGRFLHNLTEAVRLHGFRFPTDPAQARTGLCR